MHRAIVAGVVGEATRGGLTRREDAAADRDAAGHLGLALSVASLWNPGLGLGTVHCTVGSGEAGVERRASCNVGKQAVNIW